MTRWRLWRGSKKFCNTRRLRALYEILIWYDHHLKIIRETFFIPSSHLIPHRAQPECVSCVWADRKLASVFVCRRKLRIEISNFFSLSLFPPPGLCVRMFVSNVVFFYICVWDSIFFFLFLNLRIRNAQLLRKKENTSRFGSMCKSVKFRPELVCMCAMRAVSDKVQTSKISRIPRRRGSRAS